MQSTSAWSSTSGRLTYRYCRGRGIASRRALESHPCTAAQRKNTRRVEPYERRGPSFFSILVELANVLWRNPAEFGDAGGLQVLGECRQLLDVTSWPFSPPVRDAYAQTARYCRTVSVPVAGKGRPRSSRCREKRSHS